MVNHLMTRTIPPDVQGFMDWWPQPWEFSYTKGDRGLEKDRQYPLECYLARWNKQVVGPPNVISTERLMTLLTHEISESVEEIARFLNVSSDLVNRPHDSATGVRGGPTWSVPFDIT